MLSECSLSGRGQGHVSNFYIVDLENFPTASRRYRPTGDIHNSVRSRFVYDTYKTMKATRTRHGWVHMFTNRPTLTLQLHNFDLFRTCRTSSFCTVAWQLARFQLIRRITQSLSDSWASCFNLSGTCLPKLSWKRGRSSSSSSSSSSHWGILLDDVVTVLCQRRWCCRTWLYAHHCSTALFDGSLHL